MAPATRHSHAGPASQAAAAREDNDRLHQRHDSTTQTTAAAAAIAAAASTPTAATTAASMNRTAAASSSTASSSSSFASHAMAHAHEHDERDAKEHDAALSHLLEDVFGMPVAFLDESRLVLILSASLLSACTFLCLLLMCRLGCAFADWRQRRRYALFEREMEKRALFSELGEL